MSAMDREARGCYLSRQMIDTHQAIKAIQVTMHSRLRASRLITHYGCGAGSGMQAP
jgi:hypothetical protein